MYDMIAQGIGLVAMGFGVSWYQAKTTKMIFKLQICGNILFIVNYYMLGAYLAAMINLIALARATLFLHRERFRAESKTWLAIFMALYLSAYVLTFAVFGTPLTLKNIIIECMPIISMTVSHLAMRKNSAKNMRRYGLIASACWVIYNVAAWAIGAILCESFALISNISAMIRLDGLFRKKR